MAELIQYTFDDRPIYGFEIVPEGIAGPGRTYRGGGYFTDNEDAAWGWVTFWISGQKVVEARLLIGNLASLPELIEEAVEIKVRIDTGDVLPEGEFSFSLQPSVYQAEDAAQQPATERSAEQTPLDFSLGDDDLPVEGEFLMSGEGVDAVDEPDDDDMPSFDILVAVDGGLIAGFGASRGGPAIALYDIKQDEILAFAEELRDDLIAVGLLPSSREPAASGPDVALAGEYDDEKPAEEEAGSDDVHWAGHYLARPEYRHVLEDFCSYVHPESNVLEIGCGTGQGAAALLSSLGYSVTGIDTWIPALQVASQDEDLEIEDADVREITYEPEFDGALAFHAFLHIDHADLNEALTNVRNALKPGGILLVVMDPAHELLSAPSAPEALGATDFLTDVTHGEFVSTARSVGFEVLHDLTIPPLEDAREMEGSGKARAMILQAV